MIGSRDDGDGGGDLAADVGATASSPEAEPAAERRHRRRDDTRRRTDRDRHRRAAAGHQGRQEAQAVPGLAAPRPRRRDDVPRRHLQRARQLAHRQVRRQQARLRLRRHPDGHGLLADQPGRPRRGRLPGVRGPAVRPVPLTRRLAVGRLPRPLPRPRLDPRLDRLAHRRLEAGRGQQHRDPLLRRRPDPAPRDQAREHRVRPRGVVLQHPQPRVHAQPRQQRALARCRGQHRGQARQRARRRRHAGRVHRRLQRPGRGVLPDRRRHRAGGRERRRLLRRLRHARPDGRRLDLRLADASSPAS